jgi:hypothetical protein
MLKHLLFVSMNLTALVVADRVMAADDASFIPVKAPPAQDTSNVSASSASEASTHVELYSGLDFASHGWFYGWVEGTDAPFTDTDTSGLRIRLYGEAGEYQYNSETFAGVTNKETWYNGDFLVGYAFERQHLDVQVYIGAAVIDTLLSNPDPRNPVQGTAIGPMVDVEFEYLFNHNMIGGEANYTTAFDSYEVKLRLGRELAKNLYVGPELMVIGDERFIQRRIGAHVTAMNIGGARIAISGGYEDDSDTGPGAYGTIEAGIEF